MQAGVYFVTQSSGDVAKESLKNNIGLKIRFPFYWHQRDKADLRIFRYRQGRREQPETASWFGERTMLIAGLIRACRCGTDTPSFWRTATRLWYQTARTEKWGGVMKERIKGAFTKRKILHFLKMALFVVALSLILLSLLGTVAHATGLVDDTINAENLLLRISPFQLPAWFLCG